MNATMNSTIGEIVSSDYRAAAIFQRYGLDFCCGGGRTIEDACAAKQLDPARVLSEVTQACTSPDPSAPQYAAWEPSALVAHITTKHHAYVRQVLPAICGYTQKLSKVHGSRHPELLEIERLFADVAAEMTSHMTKEEAVLFPFIVKLQEAKQQGSPAPSMPFGPVENPIKMMEAEHDAAGRAMARIRELTDGYQPPADGCTTYRIGLRELEAFEGDLHAHVHLENNILFPKAMKLEAELR